MKNSRSWNFPKETAQVKSRRAEQFDKAPAPVKKRILLIVKELFTETPVRRNLGIPIPALSMVRNNYGEEFVDLHSEVFGRIDALPTRGNSLSLISNWHTGTHLSRTFWLKAKSSAGIMGEEHNRLITAQELQRQFDMEQVAMHLVAKRRETMQLRRNAQNRCTDGRRPHARTT